MTRSQHSAISTLRRLGDFGIVKWNCGRGWRFVAGLATSAERDAVYGFRAVAEPAALLESGYALPAGFAAAMRHGHQDFLDQPWQDSRAVAFFELNASFHHGIVAGSGYRFFIAAVEQYHRLRRLLTYGWVLGIDRMRQGVVEHPAILDALEQRIMPMAAEKLAQHLHAAPGDGASGRNGEQVIPGFKHDVADAIAQYDNEHGRAMCALGAAAADTSLLFRFRDLLDRAA